MGTKWIQTWEQTTITERQIKDWWDKVEENDDVMAREYKHIHTERKIRRQMKEMKKKK